MKNWQEYEQAINQALKDYAKHTYQQTILQDVSQRFVTTLACDAYEAKTSLREMFRKSPAWNEELDALVINGNRTHEPDYSVIRDLAGRIFRDVFDDAMRSNNHKFIHDLDWAVEYFAAPSLDAAFLERAIDALNDLAPGAYAPGKKKSRIFKALCVALGVADETQGSEFQRLFAQFADELNSKQIDFKLFVSINPAHFVTMSNPKGDSRGQTLTSCHSFNSTDYSYNNGCSGYARDEVTFIAFTVDDPHNPESLNNRKTTRQIFAYRPGSGLLLQSRMYNTSGGTRGAQSDSKVYRDLIQREISFCENMPNLWKTHSSTGEYSYCVVEGEGFGGYADWTYDEFDGHISFRADCDSSTVDPLVVGTYGLCVRCGDECSDGMYCSDCTCRYTCDDCGEGCNETYTVYDPRGYHIDVCECCLNDHYICCNRCGEYYHTDSIVEIHGDYYCVECAREIGICCEDCGEWDFSENMHIVYDRYGCECYVCDDCLDNYETCPHCGELVKVKSDGTCSHCGALFNEEEEEEEEKEGA